MLPIFIGLGGIVAVQMHVDNAKIRSYSISNIGELKSVHDSTEVYFIEYYHILYDEFFYSEYAIDVNIGTSKHPHYITEVNTDAVCPVLINFSSEYDIKKQKVWVGFHISKRFKELYDYNSLAVQEAAYENLTQLHSQHDVIYFTETRDERYLALIKEKIENNSVQYTDPIIIEAHYVPYESYNGYQYLLNGLLYYVIVNTVLILACLTIDVDINKKEQLLKKQTSR